MTKGIVTRFGEWIDRKFLKNAKEIEVDQFRDELRQRWNDLENFQIKDKLDLSKRLDHQAELMAEVATEARKHTTTEVSNLAQRVGSLERVTNEMGVALAATPADVSKELADLKTRMEKMELYSGMTRKVDPTKPPVVKSAFQM